MLGQTTNPLLAKTEQQIQAKVPAKLQKGLARAVTAGLQIMYTGNGKRIMQQQLGKPGDPAQNVAEGAAKLLAILYKQSNKTLPMSIGIPAATILMCEGLDFMEKAGKLQVTPDVLAGATKDMGAFVLQALGIDQAKLQGMAQQRAQVAAQGTKPGMLNTAMGG